VKRLGGASAESCPLVALDGCEIYGNSRALRGWLEIRQLL